MPPGNKIAPADANGGGGSKRNSLGDREGSETEEDDVTASSSSHRWATGLWGKVLLRVFGIGPAVLGRPASRLIHPHSPFAKAVVITTVLFLFYTALVVPVTVGFFWTHSSCYRMPTLEVDLCMDTFFVLQIGYTFVVGQYVSEEYTDSMHEVGLRYLRGAFLFDLVTSCPVSYLDLWVLMAQCGAGDEEAQDLSGLRIIRALKPLRLLKMVRILRIFRFLHVFDMIENLLRPPPLLFRVFRVLFMIGALGHACTCSFWLIKTQYSTIEEVSEFTDYHGLGPDPGLAEQYILSAYFVNTIFTTVGFGDISASNTAEQLFCVVVMYAGTIVFGVLLSEIEMAVSSMRAFPRRKGRLVQELMGFLSDKDIPSALSHKLLHWVEFDLACRYEEEMREQCLQLVPPELRRQVVDSLHHDALHRVPLLASVASRHRESLLLDLWDAMLPRSFMPHAVIAHGGEEADRLYVVMAGKVEGRLADGACLLALRPKDFFGEYTLVGDTRWGAEVGVEVSYVAVEQTLCRVLSRERFEEVVHTYPPDLWHQVQMRGGEHLARTERARAEAARRRLLLNPSDRHLAGGELKRMDSKKEVKKAEDREAARKQVVCTARWTWVVRKATLLARISNVSEHSSTDALLHKLIRRLRSRQGPHAGAGGPGRASSTGAPPSAPSSPPTLNASASPVEAASASGGGGAGASGGGGGGAGGQSSPGRRLAAPPSLSPLASASASGGGGGGSMLIGDAPRAHPFSEHKSGYEGHVRGHVAEPSLGVGRRTSVSSLNAEYEDGGHWHEGAGPASASNTCRLSSEMQHALGWSGSHSAGGVRGGGWRGASGEEEGLARLRGEVQRVGGEVGRVAGLVAGQGEAVGAQGVQLAGLEVQLAGLTAEVAALHASLHALAPALLPPAHSLSNVAAHTMLPPTLSASGNARILQPLPRTPP